MSEEIVRKSEKSKQEISQQIERISKKIVERGVRLIPPEHSRTAIPLNDSETLYVNEHDKRPKVKSGAVMTAKHVNEGINQSRVNYSGRDSISFIDKTVPESGFKAVSLSIRAVPSSTDRELSSYVAEGGKDRNYFPIGADDHQSVKDGTSTEIEDNARIIEGAANILSKVRSDVAKAETIPQSQEAMPEATSDTFERVVKAK